MKIYNKNNGKVIYDNQSGASDAALPTQAVGANSTIVINGSNSGPAYASARPTTAMEEKDAGVSNGLDVMAFPNPSTNNFKLIFRSNYFKNKITMQVTDMFGRIIEVRNVVAVQTIELGDRYRPGTYVVTVIQGNRHKQIKLVKLSR